MGEDSKAAHPERYDQQALTDRAPRPALGTPVDGPRRGPRGREVRPYGRAFWEGLQGDEAHASRANAAG